MNAGSEMGFPPFRFRHFYFRTGNSQTLWPQKFGTQRQSKRADRLSLVPPKPFV